MKPILAILLMSGTCYASVCQVADVIDTLKPGAQWTISGNDPATLVWLSTQTIPTKAQILTAVSDCQSTKDARALLKKQARVDINDTNLTVGQRFQALLILQDFDLRQ